MKKTNGFNSILQSKIDSIPKDNHAKFIVDLLKLVEEANTGDYESVYIGRK